ncbi:MAG: hypothetical protein H0X36_13805 [Sphingomonadaceae bacterium]|nr:hypothetical protein [Sphingomonadaceae bacterium]
MDTLIADYWPWLLIALVVVAAVAFLLSRRGQRIQLTPPEEGPRPTLRRETPPPVPVIATTDPVAPPPVGERNDLLQIKGLGPKLVTLLGGLGVTRFEQIAGWTEADVAAIDPQLGAFKGRIGRDRWIEQARFLSHGDAAGFEASFGKLDGGAS